MRAHHPMADGLEDLGQSKFGNQQPEGPAAWPVLSQNMRACTGPSCDQSHALQVVDGFGHGDARSIEQLAQFRLAGKPVAWLQFTRLNAGKQMIEDATMLGLVIRRIAFGRRAKFAGRFFGVSSCCSDRGTQKTRSL